MERAKDVSRSSAELGVNKSNCNVNLSLYLIMNKRFKLKNNGIRLPQTGVAV